MIGRLALFLIALSGSSAWTQQVVSSKRLSAGTDRDGNALTVIEQEYPPRDWERPAPKHCVPVEQWVLERKHEGKVLDSRPVATVCQSDDQAEVTATIGRNHLIVSHGGTQPGYFAEQQYQLSPWMPLTLDDCNFFGLNSSEFWLEKWDWRTLRSRAWHETKRMEDDVCGPRPETPYYLLIPSVAFDAQRLERERDRLGSCSLKLDASGKNGYVLWGKPDPRDPVEVRLMFSGDRTLIAQVIDPGRSTAPARSWIHADHFEIWMNPDEKVCQFGIPIDEGPVEMGFGQASQKPEVRRWTSKLADGRTAVVLRIDLPPWGKMSSGLTVVYGQGLDTRAQKRLIATSRVRRGDADTLGNRRSILEGNTADRHIVCDVVNGALDITGSRRTAIVMDGSAIGR